MTGWRLEFAAFWLMHTKGRTPRSIAMESE